MSEISIESVSSRFETHLNIKGNYRIIFSGKFGLGKTFFLNKFFDDRTNEYNKFLVSPVNYVVSSNEDIFELIKSDIIKDFLLKGKINLEALPKDTTLQRISSFVEENPLLLGNFMLKTLAKLNPSVATPQKVIDALGAIYNKYKKSIFSNKNENKTISEEAAYQWFSTAERIGHIYEHNYITKVINTILEELSENQAKRNVLIIDDLDRVDPEHIFRILNVLSAHNNQFVNENKFAFEHVIIVCDIDNIKKIFSHRYGHKVDFDGYIDKFYTADYFLFNNEDAVSTYIENYSDSFKVENEKGFIKLVFQVLSKNSILTIRKLLKHKLDIEISEFLILEVTQRQLQFPLYQIGFIEEGVTPKLKSSDIRILNFFKLASFLFGSVRAFLQEVKQNTNELNFSIIDGSTFLEAVNFLALQYHLTSKSDISLFAKVKSFDAGNNRFEHGYARDVNDYGYPEFRFFDKDFKVSLKWIRGRKYNDEETYFSTAIASAHDLHGDIVLQLKGLHDKFWDGLAIIAENCNKRGYFKSAGIIY